MSDVLLTFENAVPDWSQKVTFNAEALGFDVLPGREFWHILPATYLRKTIVDCTIEDDGTHTMTMPFSYFMRVGLMKLASQDAADGIFNRDGSQDLRHHQEDDATALGLQPGPLTNANLADAKAGKFLPDDVDDFDDDDDGDDDGTDDTSQSNGAGNQSDLLAALGSVVADDD